MIDTDGSYVSLDDLGGGKQVTEEDEEGFFQSARRREICSEDSNEGPESDDKSPKEARGTAERVDLWKDEME